MTPGLYYYQPPDWDRPVIVEVTETHVRFSPNRVPVLLRDIPFGASFKALSLADVPRVPERYFVININGHPGVVAPIDNVVPRLPNAILDLYAEQYAIERTILSWSIVRTIPMPEPSSSDLTTS